MGIEYGHVISLRVYLGQVSVYIATEAGHVHVWEHSAVKMLLWRYGVGT